MEYYKNLLTGYVEIYKLLLLCGNGLLAFLKGEIPAADGEYKSTLPLPQTHSTEDSHKRNNELTNSVTPGTELNDRTMACKGYINILASECAPFDALDCPDPLAMSCQCNMLEDIKRELSPHPHSMRQVVNIVIAVERMKHFKQMSSGEFCEDALLSVFFENVIEERRIKPVNASGTYSKTNQTLQCTICDKYKKALVLSDKQNTNDLHLKAVTLTGGNIRLKVRFSMSTFISSGPQNDGQPVCLGISNSNLYLACTQSDGSSLPKLFLKEVSGPLNTIKAGDQNGYDSLLFFRKETGTANNTFESVKHRGWFITTAFDDWERVEMYETPTDRTITFTLEDQQS